MLILGISWTISMKKQSVRYKNKEEHLWKI